MNHLINANETQIIEVKLICVFFAKLINFKPPKIFISRKESEHTTVQEDRNIIAIYYK